MSRPADLKYAKTHEWVRVEKDIATTGISDFAISALSDLVYIDMPRVGDIMILKSDASLAPVKSFVAQVKVLTHPGELKVCFVEKLFPCSHPFSHQVGYSPIAFVRTARSAALFRLPDYSALVARRRAIAVG